MSPLGGETNRRLKQIDEAREMSEIVEDYSQSEIASCVQLDNLLHQAQAKGDAFILSDDDGYQHDDEMVEDNYFRGIRQSNKH